MKLAVDQPHLVSMAFDDIPVPDFADVVVEPIPEHVVLIDVDPAVWARQVFGFSAAPKWVVGLLVIRQAVVGLIGVPRGSREQFVVRRVVGEEALIAADDRHLRFRAAVAVDAKRRLLRVTTTVELIGWRGRVYFAPVSALHPIVTRAMMRRVLRRM